MNIISFIEENPLTISALSIAAVLIVFLFAHILWRTLHRNERLRYEFITIIAHKFRTPLTYIKWISDELAQSTKDPATKEGLEQIRTADKNLIALTTTLMELTDPGKDRSLYSFERTNLIDFVQTIGEAARRNFQEKNMVLSINTGTEPIFAKIDKPRMEFVVQVLLDNALTYTPTGKPVEIGVGREGRKVIIEVKDSGIGIREQDMKRVFSRFFRASNARAMDTEGFGVGLHLARSVVKMHGGKLVAFSEGEGHGSTFSIILPTA